MSETTEQALRAMLRAAEATVAELDGELEANAEVRNGIVEKLRTARLDVRRLKLATGERVRVHKPKQDPLPLDKEAADA
jgi:hypothetical protein